MIKTLTVNDSSGKQRNFNTNRGISASIKQGNTVWNLSAKVYNLRSDIYNALIDIASFDGNIKDISTKDIERAEKQLKGKFGIKNVKVSDGARLSVEFKDNAKLNIDLQTLGEDAEEFGWKIWDYIGQACDYQM